MISAFTHIARLARAGFVFAREGVFGVVDPSLVPPPGQLALKIARLIERGGAKSGQRRGTVVLKHTTPGLWSLSRRTKRPRCRWINFAPETRCSCGNRLGMQKIARPPGEAPRCAGVLPASR